MISSSISLRFFSLLPLSNSLTLISYKVTKMAPDISKYHPHHIAIISIKDLDFCSDWNGLKHMLPAASPPYTKLITPSRLLKMLITLNKVRYFNPVCIESLSSKPHGPINEDQSDLRKNKRASV